MAKRETQDREWDGENGKDADDAAPTEVYAGGGSHVAAEAKGAMAGRRERKRGGKAQDFKDHLDETKNPAKRHDMEAGHRVNEELDKDRPDRESDKRHRRRAAKRSGGRTECMEGEGAKGRLDRKPRKRGGGVGSDANPLTTASRTESRKGGGEAEITAGN